MGKLFSFKDAFPQRWTVFSFDSQRIVGLFLQLFTMSCSFIAMRR